MSNSQPEAANLNSEKSKDIRMTNIIAARGTQLYTHPPIIQQTNPLYYSCR